jgi:hypothetical protein
MRRTIIISMVLLMLAAAGCGDDEAGTPAAGAADTAPATTSTAAPTTTTTETPTTTTTDAPTTTTTEAPTTTTTEAPNTTTTEPPEPFDPLELTLEFEIDASTDVAAGTFTASGPAVEAGVMCPSGTSFESSYEESGTTETWTTRCTCDDGRGKFSLIGSSQGAWENGEAGTNWLYAGTWYLDDGTDAFTAMAGEGTNEGMCDGSTQVCTDVHVGTVWREG